MTNNEKILFFSAPWCGPCKTMKTMLNESSDDKTLNVEIIDISQEMDTATSYQVMNVPTFIKLDKEGREVSRKIGTVTIKELKEL